MRLVYEASSTVSGWWSPALTREGWFDEDLAPDLGVTIANSGTAVASQTANSYVANSLVITLGTTATGGNEVNFIWLVAHASGTNVDPVADMSAAGFTLIGTPTVVSDGTGPSVWGYLYAKAADGSSTATVNFTPNTIATAISWARSGLNTSAPVVSASLGIQTPSSTAKDTETITSAGSWIESGFGDRTAGGYSAYADTLVAYAQLAGGASAFVQSSLGNVTAGSQHRTATGPNTAAGVDFIMELAAAPAGTTATPTEGSGTGAAYDATTATTATTSEGAGTGAAANAGPVVAPAGAGATGTGAAGDGAGAVAPSAAQAAGTGTGEAPTALVAPAAAQGAGTGTSYDASVSTSSGTNANATEGAGTGSAYDAVGLVVATHTVSGGTGAANDATVAVANSTTAAADPALGTGAALQPVAGGSGIVPLDTTTAQTPNNQSNTSLSITLPTAAVNDTIFIDIILHNAGIDTDPVFNVPAGWTQIGYALDTTGGAGAAPYGTSICRRVQAGDPTSLNLTWTVNGQGVAVASSYRYVADVVPVDTHQIEGKGTTNASYSVPLTTTQTTLIRSYFGNRSGHTYTGLADAVRGTVTLASASAITVQDTNGMVSAGSYTKTATGSGNTQAGIEAAYALIYGLPVTNVTALPPAAGGTGAAHDATVLDDRVGGGNAGNNASPSVTLSSQIKPGQVVLVHLAMNNADSVTATPTNLTQIDGVLVGTSSASDHIYYLLADGSTAGSTLTWTLSITRNWTVTYLALSNVDQQAEAIINAVESVGDNVTATTSFTMPTDSTSADSYIVEVFTAKGDGVAITDLGFPAGYTQRAEIINPSGTFNMASGIADRVGNPSTAGTYGGDTWTTDQNAVTTIRHLIAFRVADTSQTANASGEAPDAYPLVVALPSEAAGSGSAPFDPNGVTASTTLIADNPIYGIGAAYDPLVQTGIFVTATPSEAAGTGTANDTTIGARALPSQAAGTGDSPTATFSVTATHSVSAGVGSALDPGVSTSQGTAALEAVGSGVANDATVSTDNLATAPPETTFGVGTAYNATVLTFTSNDVVIAAGLAQGIGVANTVFGYDVGVLLRISRDSLPGFTGERWLLSQRPRRRATVTTYTEVGLFVGDDGTVIPVDTDAPLEPGELIRNPSALLIEPNSDTADALIAAGYTLEPAT